MEQEKQKIENTAEDAVAELAKELIIEAATGAIKNKNWIKLIAIGAIVIGILVCFGTIAMGVWGILGVIEGIGMIVGGILELITS